MTVDELRKYITTEETDAVLAGKLSALELTIRRYTNNRFLKRDFMIEADIRGGVFMSEALIPFEAGDTIMISNRGSQVECLCTVKEVTDDTTFTVNERVGDANDVLAVLVDYPLDVKLGAVNMLKWQLRNEAANNGDKSQKDIQSETLSRHSVTYVTDTTEADLSADFGVPKKYVAFLKLYKKARF
jgi:hypothetical protein